MFIRKLTFRTKLLGITALPLALIGYLAFQDVQDARANREAAAQQAAELDRQEAVADLAGAIGTERGVLFDPAALDADLAAARVAVDEAVDRLRSPALGLQAEPLADVERFYAEVLTGRALIGESVVPIQVTIASGDDEELLRAVEEFSSLPAQVLEIAEFDVGDRETLANLTTIVLVERAREALAVEGTALQQALAEGAPSQSTLERVGALIGSSNEAIDVSLDLGEPETAQAIAAYLDGPAWAGYEDLRGRFTRLLIGQHVMLDPSSIVQQRAAVAAQFDAREADLRATMEADTIALDEQASQDLFLAIAVSLGALVLLAGFLFLLARSIRKSLGRVENRATEIATTELPAIVQIMRTEGDLAEIPRIEEIPVETRDEIGRLSAAFNELHNTAVRLAGEQAASRAVVAHMFVNLGRRNQKLLMRILRSLDELEREESDPDRLSKLYDVDHLVTRMRRNAESLLILADADVARRFEGPVLVSELLRSTMAEVSEYDRVKLSIMDDVEITGDAAADLAHLISELTENAAKFSPPAEPIEIIARYTRMGYILAVVDSGMGLAEDEILEANARIASAATSAETPARNLGHFVVGKLAGKYGMEVEIFERVPAGLTVRVRIPRSLIVSQPPVGVIDTATGPVPTPREPRPSARPTPAMHAGRPGEAGAGNGHPPGHPGGPGFDPPPPGPDPASVPRPPEIRRNPVPAMSTPGSNGQLAGDGPPATQPAPPRAPERRPPSVFEPGASGGDIGSVFGTTRRVAGANLPDHLGPGPRPEPDAASLRRPADSVRSDLGALQRGLSGEQGERRPRGDD